MTIGENQLLGLIEKSPEEMDDAELETAIRNIRHTGIQRAARKAEKRTPKTAGEGRESVAIKNLRLKLEAAGTPAEKIEQIVTLQKNAMKAAKK